MKVCVTWGERFRW